ncbi:MAG: Spy/CpxP family protein refolding chaperone [Candidatus Thiodiazotropha sp. (ex Dulcina madagascariensis)]|nr:Spy/CpxP family protein refolding chaperone [Candidatus Thiodiazotropha sp. (ex Dulcina madagascariensis)]
MKQTTKRYLGIAVASALVIGVASGVFARGGFGPGWGGHHGMMGGPGGMQGLGAGPGLMMRGDPVAYVDQQLTRLKGTIGITADQEIAWNAYAEAVKGKAGLMLAHRQTMFGSVQTTPEQRLTFHEQGLEQMLKVTTASRDLHAILTLEQQAKAGNLIGFRHGFR